MQEEPLGHRCLKAVHLQRAGGSASKQAWKGGQVWTWGQVLHVRGCAMRARSLFAALPCFNHNYGRSVPTGFAGITPGRPLGHVAADKSLSSSTLSNISYSTTISAPHGPPDWSDMEHLRVTSDRRQLMNIRSGTTDGRKNSRRFVSLRIWYHNTRNKYNTKILFYFQHSLKDHSGGRRIRQMHSIDDHSSILGSSGRKVKFFFAAGFFIGATLTSVSSSSHHWHWCVTDQLKNRLKFIFVDRL